MAGNTGRNDLSSAARKHEAADLRESLQTNPASHWIHSYLDTL